MNPPAERHYPLHASLPVEQLLVPGPTAWATGAEMMAALVVELQRKPAQRRAA